MPQRLSGIPRSVPELRQTRDILTREEMMPGKIKPKGCSCLFLPVTATARLFRLALKSIGRLALIIAGIGLMIAGVLISMTVIGACLGVPLMALGLSLIVRGLF